MMKATASSTRLPRRMKFLKPVMGSLLSETDGSAAALAPPHRDENRGRGPRRDLARARPRARPPPPAGPGCRCPGPTPAPGIGHHGHVLDQRARTRPAVGVRATRLTRSPTRSRSTTVRVGDPQRHGRACPGSRAAGHAGQRSAGGSAARRGRAGAARVRPTTSRGSGAAPSGTASGGNRTAHQVVGRQHGAAGRSRRRSTPARSPAVAGRRLQADEHRRAGARARRAVDGGAARAGAADGAGRSGFGSGFMAPEPRPDRGAVPRVVHRAAGRRRRSGGLGRRGAPAAGLDRRSLARAGRRRRSTVLTRLVVGSWSPTPTNPMSRRSPDSLGRRLSLR